MIVAFTEWILRSENSPYILPLKNTNLLIHESELLIKLSILLRSSLSKRDKLNKESVGQFFWVLVIKV